MTRPVFIFGISGATWNVIDPLFATGLLPHLRQLQEQGCRADLLSIRVEGDKHFRPQVAWASIATGCEPARHGLTKFYHTADDLKVPTLWELFQNCGLSVGIYGWPSDWPPRPTNGFIVPSHLARDSQTWPRELEDIKALDRQQQDAERAGGGPSPSRLARTTVNLYRQGARLRTIGFLGAIVARSRLLADTEERSLLMRAAKLELSADLFARQCKRFDPDFRSFHTFIVDFVSHRFWRYFEPELFPDTPPEAAGRFRNAVADAYMRTDKILGRLLKIMPRDSVVAVVSEHGMKGEPDSAEVGPWRYVIDASRLSKLIGLEDRLVGSPVARWIAYRSAAGTSLPADAADRLRSILVAETGLPLFQVHAHGDDEIVVKFSIDASVPCYQEGNLERLTIQYQGRSVPFTAITRRLGRARSAMHDGRGILLLRGPGIRQGAQLADASVMDIAPTIMHAAELPQPAGVDGKVLEVFSQPSRSPAYGGHSVDSN